MIENELKNFFFYLKDKGYDDDVCDYILKSFESLNYHYPGYINFDPDIIDCSTFIKRYIEIFKSVDKFVILRDINEDKDFEEKVTPTSGIILPIGYIKGSDNRYIITSNKPDYYSSLMGLTNNIEQKVTILFDETAKARMQFLLETLIHELTHVYQKGFELPWFIMNRELFTKVLREGNAMRESRYVNGINSNFYTIPFNYDEVENKFVRGNNNEYRVYKYLYYKLETLLGHEFMSDWAVTGGNNNFLFQARKQLDEKYGKNTFKKIYESIELILLSLNNFSVHDIELIAEQQQNMALLYACGNDISLDISLDEYDRISDILKDDAMFKEQYNKEKESLISSKQYLEKLGIGKPSIINKLDEKINNFNEKTYRLSLEQSYDSVKEEIDARKDAKYFKSIMASNVVVCNEINNNHKSLTDAIVALESITLKCLIADIENHLEPEYRSFQKYRYYVTNVGRKVFDYKAMSNVKKKLTFLGMKTLLQSKNEIENDKEEKALK